MKHIYIIIILIGIITVSKAQVYNIWSFGSSYPNKGNIINMEVGTSFKKFVPNKIYSNQLNDYASICDSVGRLLWYSDGLNIYNSSGNLIQGGDSIYSKGLNSRSLIALPQTSIHKRYFLIHSYINNNTPPFNQIESGLFYTIIDMDSNNQHGKVTRKNIRISNDTLMGIGYCKSNIDGSFLLFASKFPDSFLIYRIKNEVVELVNKESSNLTGLYHNKYASNIMEISNDGYLFCAESHESNDIKYSRITRFKIDFSDYTLDNEKILLSKEMPQDGFNNFLITDLEISPNDSVIYYTQGNLMFQYSRKIKKKNQLKLLFNKGIVFIELGLDGVLYMTRQGNFSQRNYFHIIKEPDSFGGNCDIRLNQIEIPSGFNFLQFPNSINENLRVRFRLMKNCVDTFMFVNLCDTNRYNSFVWKINNEIKGFDKNLQYKFEKSGNYLISLIASTNNGFSQTYSDTLSIFKSVTAGLEFQMEKGCQWIAYDYKEICEKDTINPKSGEKWNWDFGDDSFSSKQNPRHVYSSPGLYSISLHYSNGFCSDSFNLKKSVKIFPAPKPGFEVDNDHNCLPFIVKVTNKSEGIVESYQYDFGDGTIDTFSSPSHEYKIDGLYYLVQTLKGPSGCITKDSLPIKVLNGYDEGYQLDLKILDVDCDNGIYLEWAMDSISTNYILTRINNRNNNTIQYLTSNNYFFDSTVSLINSDFSYKVQGVNSCKSLSSYSNKMSIINVEHEREGNNFVTLYWHVPKLLNSSIIRYEVFEKQVGFFNLLSAIKNDTTLKDLSFLNDTSKIEKCYKIRAVDQFGNYTTSNCHCLPFESVLYIPNAFTPNNDGLNDTFKPEFINCSNIVLKVFNRWGELVFEGKNDNIFWDGKCKQNKCPNGIYTYIFTAKNHDGYPIVKSGKITLIR